MGDGGKIMAGVSNPTNRSSMHTIIVIIAALCTAIVTKTLIINNAAAFNSSPGSTQQYVLTVAGEQSHFIAQPHAGYVLKTRDETWSTDTLKRFIKNDGDVKISPIRGLGRKGVFVVYNERSADPNVRTIKMLRIHNEFRYEAPLFSSNGEMVAIIPEIVVRVKPNTPVDQLEMLCVRAACTIKKRMEFTEKEYLIEVLGSDAEAVFLAVEKLGQAPNVEWACPNTASQPKLCSQSVSYNGPSVRQLEKDGSEQDANTPGVFPNDEYFPMQWHLHNTGQSGGTPGADIRASEAWEITTGDPNIAVAVIGIGVDSHHPDLVNNLVPGYDFWQLDDLPDPSKNERLDAHETLCAGVVAAEGNNKIGIAGVAYKCKIMPIRNHSMTSWITRDEDATALRWAAAHGADIISCSWGRSNAPVIHSAVQDVTKIGGMGREGKGCIVLFAVGIDGAKIPSGWTETYPEVIAVGATDHNDMRWHYSSYGPELDIMAPSGCDGGWCGELVTFWSTDQTGPGGYSILNSDPNILDYSEYFGGTSVSCPIVAGVAALVLSVDPDLTNLEVQRILYHSAHDLGEPGWDEYYGWGRVDARAAVEMALNPPLHLLCVDDDGTNDSGPGDSNISDPDENGSAEHPFDSIQEAIDFALDNEQIVVLAGRYTGKGNRDIDFKGKILTIRSEAGPATCVIDCQGLGRGFNFHSGEGRDTVMEGFTIINGKGDNGGAISCMNNSCPTIRNCIFSRNTALGLGGAVSNSDSAVALINCTFHANTDMFGGGAVCNFSEGMIITNCILRDNEPGEVYSFGTMDVTYSNISGGFTGEGNINVDPLFADADNGDYHLKSQAGRWEPIGENWITDEVTSPCIDAGDPNSPVGEEPEPNGGIINMGAYGGTAEASKSPSATDAKFRT